MALVTFLKLSPGNLPKEDASPNNPFVNATWRPSWVQRIKMSFVAATLFPIRAVTLGLTCLATLTLSKLVILGQSEEEIKNEPLKGWRLRLRNTVNPISSRLMLFFGFGIMVRQSGKCAPTKEVSIFRVGVGVRLRILTGLIL